MEETKQQETKRQYVCGFLLTPPMGAEVALIHKNRPKWQAGKINGIGGKVEEGESLHEAMIREFREETGATVLDWELVVVYHEKDAQINFFRAFATQNLRKIVKTTTDEQVHVYQTSKLPHVCHWNLNWLIPLCLDSHVKFPIVVHERELE